MKLEPDSHKDQALKDVTQAFQTKESIQKSKLHYFTWVHLF